jgi:hypothetical protein
MLWALVMLALGAPFSSILATVVFIIIFSGLVSLVYFILGLIPGIISALPGKVQRVIGAILIVAFIMLVVSFYVVKL